MGLAAAATVNGPRSHAERSASMRERLLAATVSSLAENGYGGTTTLEVQKRAGVSRGALLHHYPSRPELILAAMEYVLREREAGLRARIGRPPRGDRLAWAIRVIWETFDSGSFAASLELWLAARNDPDLKAALIPQERLWGAANHEWAERLFGPATAHPHFPAVLEMLLDAMRGAAARSVLRSPGSDKRLLAEWTLVVKTMLATDAAAAD